MTPPSVEPAIWPLAERAIWPPAKRAICTAAGLAFLLAAAVALGQTGERAGGRVVGPDDAPLAGAVVRIWPAGDPEAGRPPIETDARGRWSAVGLAPGRWEIRVTARGYFPAEGWFQVLAARPTPDVEVGLRSLAETSPGFAENPGTVVGWIEKGNVLLEQGEPAAARAEYEKALGALTRTERPEVLQAVARTHFMEGDADAALGRLEEALTIEPGDEDLRTLYLTLLKTAGKVDEAEERLAAVERAHREYARAPQRGGEEARHEVPTRPPPAIELPPVEPAAPGRTGTLRVALAERSPLSALDVYVERWGDRREDVEAADPDAAAYDLADESYHLFVPDSYSEETPHGLLVWISPTPLGGFRNPELGEVLAEHRLIWVGAHGAGNRRPRWDRAGLALDAVHNLERLYELDQRRIYVGGYSGGGRVSSAVAMLFPEVFRGGLFLYGCDYFDKVPVPDRPGSSWPARFPRPTPEALDGLRAESRFVLLTGERDFNRAQTRQIWKRMERDGFEHVTYLEIPEADHYFGLPPEWLERAIAALDAPLPK